MSSEPRQRRTFTDDEIEALAAADELLPPISAEELSAAVALSAGGRTKVPISIRLDEDALATIKAQGPRYQTRLNDLVVAYAAGRVVSEWPDEVAAHFRPDMPGFADRVAEALREIVRQDEARPPRSAWPTDASLRPARPPARDHRRPTSADAPGARGTRRSAGA
ncbi:MAG: BrnA antitoxin of type toxin-antitoxin system [Gemmatimonadetes bacterium]|nr:BrnA antitoxin of type toxin-antitoxin system [Gemmatimonadota bacterium]